MDGLNAKNKRITVWVNYVGLRRLQRELFDKVVYDELDVLSSQKLHEIAQESLNQYNARGE